MYRRRVKERDAKLDHKQVEMDDLERKVANICKQSKSSATVLLLTTTINEKQLLYGKIL